MWTYRVTVTLPGYRPVWKRYPDAAEALQNAARAIDHPTRPVVEIEKVLLTLPGA